MGNELRSSNGIGVTGYVEIEVYNPVDGVRRTIKQNTVVNAGKKWMAAESLNTLIHDMCSTTQGQLVNSDKIYSLRNYNGRLYKTMADKDLGFKCQLVNLPSDVELTNESNFVNVYDEAMNVDVTKVIGHASNSLLSADSREGVLDNPNKTHMIDQKAVANRWKFAEGIATGEFNHIIFGPGFVDGPNGIYTAMNIAKLDYANNSLMSRGTYIGPGMGDITANNEIAYWASGVDGVERGYKYLLDTGETQVLDTTSKAYLALQAISGYRVAGTEYVNGVLFILDTSSSFGTVYAVDVNNTFGVKSLINYANSMWKEDSNTLKVVVNTGNGYETDNTDNRHRLYTHTVNSYSSINSSYVNMANAGLGGLPSDFGYNLININKAGGKYFISNWRNTSIDISRRGEIICTNLADVAGTLVGMSGKTLYYGYSDNTSQYDSIIGVISIGTKRPNYISDYQREIVVNGTAYDIDDINKFGVWVSPGWWSNMISFVKLNTPINKGPDDIVWVSYGYVFD